MVFNLGAKFRRRHAGLRELRHTIKTCRIHLQRNCFRGYQKDVAVQALRNLELKPSTENLYLTRLLLKRLNAVGASFSILTPISSSIHYLEQYGISDSLYWEEGEI